MTTKRGGVKQKNPNKKGFTPVLDMINKPTSVVNLLTYASLSGFIFTLTVNPDDEEYYNLKNTRFTEPVLSYILKFAVVTPDDAEVLPSYKGKVKSTESPDTFYSEAQIQQNAWKRSITGGRNAICPPVANFSLFNNYHSKNLLDILVAKTSSNPALTEENSLFRYLQQVIINNIVDDHGSPVPCELGVIVMPTVNQATTIGTYITDNSIPGSIKNQAMVQLAAKAMRLFVDTGIIHFDLHPNNALIYTNSGIIQTLIIDFGRASDITNGKDDDFLTIPEKHALIEKKNEYFNDILSYDYNGTPWNSTSKVNYVKIIMGTLTSTDKRVNHMLYPGHFSLPANIDKYQMYWYEMLKTQDPLLEESFDILKESVVSLGVRRHLKTIEGYVTSGQLLGLNKPVVNYYSEVSTISITNVKPKAPNPVASHFDENDCGEYSCVIAGLKGSMKRLSMSIKHNKRNRRNRSNRGKTKKRRNY